MPDAKPFSKFRLLLDLLGLAALVWAAVEAYWFYFKLKIWVAGFSTGVFWVAGLLAGFIYFYSAHKLQERLEREPRAAQKFAFLALFALGLISLNPLTIGLALWLLTPPGGLHTVAFWFFFGCAAGSALVLLIERLFASRPRPAQ
ncbi:MAG TPA: hypothetical protein VMU88_03580 [bacterium]|nr:hypothetical protein [bacterium]